MAKAKGNKQTRNRATDKNEQQTTRKGNGQTEEPKTTELSLRGQSMPAALASPFSFMRRFGEDMEQLFEEFGFGGLMPRGLNQVGAWTPQVEMFERDGQLVIRADLPGINKDNVQVELRDNSVIIRGERQEEHKEEREGFYRTERSYGSFYREIPLPSGARAENATANFSDGVLEITMPAPKGESHTRQLQIKDTGGRQQAKSQAAGAGR